jgi:hypothetical protein
VEALELEHLSVGDLTEPEFNVSAAVKAAGNSVAHRDFKVFKTRGSTPVEAWDLWSGKTVCAVKFGTPQKLNYVVDQATNVLEILRNRANVNKIPDFARYCLWMATGARSLSPTLPSLVRSSLHVLAI